jgi:hypothetical protein
MSATRSYRVAEPLATRPDAATDDRLRRRVDDLWRKHDELVALYGDPDDAFDRMIEEEFGTPEAAQALMDWVLADVYGEGWDDDPSSDGR